MRYFFRIDGAYAAFEVAGYLFAPDGSWIGSIDNDGNAWRLDGSYLGEVFAERYILRRRGIVTPARRARLARPPRPARPARPARLARIAHPAGYDDVLA